MRSLQFNVIEFIVNYDQAFKAGMTMNEMAEMFGYTYNQVRQRRYALAARGITLPDLKHGLEGRPSNNEDIRRGRKPVRLVERKTSADPACTALARAEQEIPDGSITITYLIGVTGPAFTTTTGD